MLVRDFIKDFRLLAGDTTMDSPTDFLIAGLNWSLRELPSVPRLDKIFSHHYTFNLDAKGHYRWDLTGDFFDHITDVEYLKFWSSTGGQPCPLNICWQSPKEFYRNNLPPQVAKAGIPCHYTLEQEQDKLWLVLDRPSDTPIILDYIAYGIPKMVTSLDDEVPISKVCENAILTTLRVKFYEEADDLAFAGAFADYISNVQIQELTQEIYKRRGCEPNYILGG